MQGNSRMQHTEDHSNSKPIKKGRSSFSILIIFICLAIIGIALTPLLHIQLNPSQKSGGLRVSYSWYNASPRVIEQEVTSRLEGIFSAVKGLKNIRSVSGKGYGVVDLEFKPSANLDALRFEIASLIRQMHTALPSQVSYPVITASAESNFSDVLLSYTLNARLSASQIEAHAEKNMVPLLRSIKGIDRIQVYGATPYHWQIKFHSEDIQSLGLKAHDIEQIINRYISKDFIGRSKLATSSNGSFKEIPLTLEYLGFDSLNWNTIPIRQVDGRTVYLPDIAEIRYGEQQPQSYFRINGLNTVNMVVYAQKGVNSVSIAKQVKATIEDYKANLPAGYSIITTYDGTEYLSKELTKILLRIGMTLVILLLFVIIFSRNLSYVAFIIISLVINLCVSAILYYFLDIELHLYSLAGLTISFGFIIDNAIVMIDHYRNTSNRKVFLAMLGSALTIIGALCTVFLLDETQKNNLTDFVIVIVISLSVSLMVSLFFIPALMDKIRLTSSKKYTITRRSRRVVRFSTYYSSFILFARKWRWAFIMALIFSFGIPIHWLPDRLEGESQFVTFYNGTIGTQTFTKNYRPTLEKIFGGTIRLFTQNVFEKSYYVTPARTTLFVNASMAEGCTVQQLNETMRKMENVIGQHHEVETFQTSVTGYKNGTITIYVKEPYENTRFIHQLKSELEHKAITLGSVDWHIFGVGQAFSNQTGQGSKTSNISLEGYNYEELYRYATLLQNKLLKMSRVRHVQISGSGDDTEMEYNMDFNTENFALHRVTPVDFYDFLNEKSYASSLLPVYVHGDMQPVSLVSDIRDTFNAWSFKNEPVIISGRTFKMSQFGQIEKTKSSNNIHKFNQQYQLLVEYDFIGPDLLLKMVRQKTIDDMNAILPIGYRAFSTGWHGWDKKDKKQYYLIALVMVIIFLICSVLFESLQQPLAILAVIPISFIGLFLTFYGFDINFDQGGFAAFILLCGVVVNAGLYITNDFNNFRNGGFSLRSYLKAFNYKIRPILLVLLSNTLALIPSIYHGEKEVFWFAFAAGSIGGILFSFIGILVYLPLFLKLSAPPKTPPASFPRIGQRRRIANAN